MPIRKRRPLKRINKNEARLLRRAAEERQANSAGNILTRFPMVNLLDIQMEFVSHQGQVLGSEHWTFHPNDLLNFTVDCPGRCGNGRMDMETVVKQLINNHQSSLDTKGMCRQILYADSDETCNCELRCKITAQYLPSEVAV